LKNIFEIKFSYVTNDTVGTSIKNHIYQYTILCDMVICDSRLGGVVVSVLATVPKGCGFKPGQGDGFLRAIKIRITPSSQMGSKVERSMS
jgi:hypothetical protein